MKKLLELELNYSELMFIMDIDKETAQRHIDIFLDGKPCVLKDLVKVNDLKDCFEGVKSCDARYDGQNELLFNLEHKQTLYAEYLNLKSFIKAKKFKGGKTIFYKICTLEQLNHAKYVFENKYEFLYGKNKQQEIC